MNASRINLGHAAPELYRIMSEMDATAARLAGDAGLSDGFTHLLRLRASQINQCAFCVRLHARDALKSGESADRVSVLPAWRESGYFDERERGALALIESITDISRGQVPEPVYEQAHAVLGREATAAVEWLGVVINAWNRIAISSRYPVRP
jgi:AhpD family alkylhydroperoxidase